jgi:hypothetical protein
MDDSLLEAIAQLESDLGVERTFLLRLFDDSDWSFVIKTHALIETALSHLLGVAVRDPRATKIFQLLDTSNERTGKLAFIKTMELLPQRQCKFVKYLSELRNQLVHDVRNTSFTFASHVASLDSGQRRKLRDAFTWRVKPHPNAPLDDWNENAFDSTKMAIWVNLLQLLSESYQRKAHFLDLMYKEDA